jgi:hypothetical protein
VYGRVGEDQKPARFRHFLELFSRPARQPFRAEPCAEFDGEPVAVGDFFTADDGTAQALRAVFPASDVFPAPDVFLEVVGALN